VTRAHHNEHDVVKIVVPEEAPTVRYRRSLAWRAIAVIGWPFALFGRGIEWTRRRIVSLWMRLNQATTVVIIALAVLGILSGLRWLTKWLFPALLVCVFTGCVQTDRSEHATKFRRKTYHEEGIADGKPYAKDGVETVDEDRQSTGQQRTGVDPAMMQLLSGAVGAASKAATGDWSGVLEIGLGGAAALTTAFAAHQRARANAEARRADEHKADAEAGWSQAQEAARAAGGRA
jgi:hypothetical protein